MASYYEHNFAAFGKEVLQASFMLSAMRARATAVMSTAMAMAPVDTGEYESSFELSDGITAEYPKGPRVYARVTNTSNHAAAVEYGFGKVPRYRILGKSLYAAGGDVKLST